MWWPWPSYIWHSVPATQNEVNTVARICKDKYHAYWIGNMISKVSKGRPHWPCEGTEWVYVLIFLRNNKHFCTHTHTHCLSLSCCIQSGTQVRGAGTWDQLVGWSLWRMVREVYYSLPNLNCDLPNQQLKVFCARELIVWIAAGFEWENMTSKAIDHIIIINTNNNSPTPVPRTWSG